MVATSDGIYEIIQAAYFPYRLIITMNKQDWTSIAITRRFIFHRRTLQAGRTGKHHRTPSASQNVHSRRHFDETREKSFALRRNGKQVSERGLIGRVNCTEDGQCHKVGVGWECCRQVSQRMTLQ